MGIKFVSPFDDNLSNALRNAAKFLKEKYSVHPGEVIAPYLEREFDIRFVFDEYNCAMVEFPSERDCLIFMLKWQ